MNIFLVTSAFFNGIVAITAGLTQLSKNPQNKLSRVFALYCLFMGIWSFGYFFPLTPESHDLSLLSFQILHVGAIFLGIVTLHFVSILLNIYQQQKKFILGGYVLNFIIVLLVPTRFFISDVVEKYNFSYWAEVGWVYHIWLFFWLLTFFYSFYLLLIHYKSTVGIKQLQIKYVLIGYIVAVIGGSTNFFLFYGINIPPVLNFLASLQILAFAYAIARYRPVDVNTNLLPIVKKCIFFVISLLATYYFYLLLEDLGGINKFFHVLVVLLVAHLLYAGLVLFGESRFFYKLIRLSHFDFFKKTLETFCNGKIFYPSFKALVSEIESYFVKKLGVDSVGILFLEKSDAKKYKHTIKYFKQKTNTCLITEELYLMKKEEKKNPLYFHEIEDLGAVLFPIWGNRQKLIGFFVLGHKLFKNPYTQEELNAIQKTVNHIELAISILQYNQNLTEEVVRQTAKIEQQRKRIEKAYEQLQQLDTAKDSFLSIASHELRTPMTIIKGYSDFLLSGQFGKLNETQADFVGRIFKGTENLIALVNDILDLSKLEADRMPFKFSEIDIKTFLEEELEGFQLICKTKRIRLELSHSGKLRKQIKTDPDKLKEIMNNLLGNAYKFTPEDGMIKVHMTPYKKDKKFLQINIEDTGVGIPDSDLEIVFERFSQVENYLQKEHTGTGLGLTIVKKIIEKLGGKIWVEPGREIGANFILLIPYK